MRLTPHCLAKYLFRTPGTPISDWRPFRSGSSHRSVVPSATNTFSLGPDSETVIPSAARNPGWIAALLSPMESLQIAVRAFSAILLLLLSASSVRAEYIVLQSGLRLHVTGYQLMDDKYRLQMQGGWMDVSVSDVVKIEPEEVFVPIPQPPAAAPPPSANQSPYHEFVLAAASRYGVDPELISSVMEVESHFDANAISPKNARGLMQLLPETAARLGVKNIFDPKENIDAGTHYLHDLLQLYKNDLTLALAAYNAGPDKVQKYGNVPPFNETVTYVKRVKRTYDKNKSAAPAKAAAQPTAPKTTAADPPPANAPQTKPDASATPGTPATQPGAPATQPSTPPKTQNP